MTTKELIIKEKFRTLIPALSDDEFAQLEANIIADGCREPVVTWYDTIVDGHNRYAICRKHGIAYETLPKTFCDESAAIIWIIKNQFGRRNLPPYTRAELALKLEPLIASKAKANQQQHGGTAPGKPKTLRQNSAEVKSIKTRDELAKISGLSHDTITKAKLIELYADETTKEKLRKGEVKINTVAKEIKRQKEVDFDKPAKPRKNRKTIAEGRVSLIAVKAAEAALKQLDGALERIGLTGSVSGYLKGISKEIEYVRNNNS